jgi:hypothetical protein
MTELPALVLLLAAPRAGSYRTSMAATSSRVSMIRRAARATRSSVSYYGA